MRQLEDVIVKGIALTGKPANRRPFLLKKSQEPAVSDSSEPSIQAAPSEILDAVRAVALAKGADAHTSDALEAVAHLVYGNPDLTLQDLMAVGQAAQVQDVAKAAKKKDEPDAEAEEEGYDDESEQDPSDDEDDGDDEDEEDSEAADKKGKKMPAFLKEKLKKDGWNESDHPRDDNGRFGSGGSGDSNVKANSAAGEAKSEKSAGAHYRAQSAHEKASSDARDLANKMSHNSVEKLGYLAASKAHAIAAEKHGVAARQTSEGHEDAKSSRSAALRASSAADKKTDIYDRRSRTQKSHLSADHSANQGGPMEAETAEEVAISKSQYDSIREELAKSEARIAAFEYKEALAIEKSANEAKYGDLTLDHDKLAKSMLALRKSSPEQVEALEQSLSAANEQVRVSKASGASIFARKSSDGFAAPATASADKFRAMVEEHVKKSGGSKAQAIAAIAKTKDGIAAYKEMQGAN